jgi:hypothetical protein
MAYNICPDCMDGAHSECQGHGCYCDCQLEPIETSSTRFPARTAGEIQSKEGRSRNIAKATRAGER